MGAGADSQTGSGAGESHEIAFRVEISNLSDRDAASMYDTKCSMYHYENNLRAGKGGTSEFWRLLSSWPLKSPMAVYLTSRSLR